MRVKKSQIARPIFFNPLVMYTHKCVCSSTPHNDVVSFQEEKNSSINFSKSILHFNKFQAFLIVTSQQTKMTKDGIDYAKNSLQLQFEQGVLRKFSLITFRGEPLIFI